MSSGDSSSESTPTKRRRWEILAKLKEIGIVQDNGDLNRRVWGQIERLAKDEKQFVEAMSPTKPIENGANHFLSDIPECSESEGHDEMYLADVIRMYEGRVATRMESDLSNYRSPENEGDAFLTPTLIDVLRLTWRPNADGKAAILVAVGGEEFFVEDRSSIPLASQMLGDDDSPHTRLCIPFKSSIVKRIAQLLNDNDDWKPKDHYLTPTMNLEMSAALDFLLAKGPCRSVLDYEYGLFLRPPGGIEGHTRFANLEHFKALLLHYFEITCKVPGASDRGTCSGFFRYVGADGTTYHRDEVVRALSTIGTLLKHGAKVSPGSKTSLGLMVEREQRFITVPRSGANDVTRCKNQIANHARKNTRPGRASYEKLMRRAGIAFNSEPMLNESEKILESQLKHIVSGAMHSMHCRRKHTSISASRSFKIEAEDVRAALEECGRPVWGCGVYNVPAGLFSDQIYKVLKQIDPKRHIGPKALAVANDYCSTVVVRILAKAATLSAAYRKGLVYDSENPTSESEYELARYKRLLRVNIPETSLTCTVLVDNKLLPTDSSESPDAPFILSKTCVNSRHILDACKSILPGALAKYAVDEGSRASTKFEHWRIDHDDADQWGAHAGLQFCPYSIVAIAARVCEGTILTDVAACGLAAVVEYMAAELLEVGGTAARKDGKTLIRPRHLSKALGFDEDLRKFRGSASIREGGSWAVPFEKQTDLPGASKNSFENIFTEIIRAAPSEVVVDPRDGLHKYLSPTGELKSMPELDAACVEDRATRRAKALGSLTASQKSLLVKSEQDDRLLTLFRMCEIQEEQLLTLPVFGHGAIGTWVSEIALKGHTQTSSTASTPSYTFTLDALVILGSFSENYLLELFQCSGRLARHANRIHVVKEDVELARRFIA